MDVGWAVDPRGAVFISFARVLCEEIVLTLAKKGTKLKYEMVIPVKVDRIKGCLSSCFANPHALQLARFVSRMKSGSSSILCCPVVPLFALFWVRVPRETQPTPIGGEVLSILSPEIRRASEYLSFMGKHV